MIIAEWKPLSELMTSLKSYKNVLLVGCATCVTECAVGGDREINILASSLRMGLKNKGYDINFTTYILERACELRFVKKLTKIASKIDSIMSFSCGIGMQLIADHYIKKPLLPGVNTTSLAIRELPGLWTTRCCACGDCVLGETFGLCPIARCAKGLMNGPCGGTRKNGYCEIDANIHCIWHLIIERAKIRGNLSSLYKIHKPRSWDNSAHGGPKRIIRNDLCL